MESVELVQIQQAFILHKHIKYMTKKRIYGDRFRYLSQSLVFKYLLEIDAIKASSSSYVMDCYHLTSYKMNTLVGTSLAFSILEEDNNNEIYEPTRAV